jgi:lipocalin
VAEAVVANHDWTYTIVTEAAAAGHQGFADYWHKVMEPTARTGAGACGISATYLLQQAENMSWVNRCGRSRVDGGSDRDGSATADSSCVASARSH